MVGITLGNYSTVNGKNVLTGGASNLDIKGLVDGLVTAKRLPAVRLETVNKTIDAKNTALTELKTIFNKLQTSVDVLRNPGGVDTASKNIFEYRKATSVGTGGIIASNYVDVTVQPGAASASYTIDSITQLAKATKQQTGTFAIANTTTASAVTANGSPTAGLFRAGTVNLRAVDGTVGGIAVTLNENDTLQTVAAKFNEVSSRTGMQATILNVSSGNYKLIFTATKTGTTYGFNLGATSPTVGYGVEADASGVLSQLSFNTIETAQNAILSVDGSSITRESNAIADVIDGVTFSLKDAPTPAGSIAVSISPDTELAAKAISQFADAYNEFRLFVSKQAELDENNQPKDTAVLYNNTVFRTFINDISSEISQIVSGITGSNPTQLRDIGVTLDNFAGDEENLATTNILTIDTEVLNSALLSNFSGVRNLFEYRQTSDNVNFLTYKRSNNIAGVSSFTFSIDQTTNTYTATYTDPVDGLQTVTLDYTALSSGGVSLAGPAGSALEGMEFVYAATGNATVNVTVTQGFGDRFYNMLDGYLDADAGTLTNEFTELTDTKKRNTDEIAAIDGRMTAYREKLLQQYSSLESALTRASQILQLLDAQSNARNNSN